MCICIYVYVHIYTGIHIYIYIYIRVHIISTSIQIHEYTSDGRRKVPSKEIAVATSHPTATAHGHYGC